MNTQGLCVLYLVLVESTDERSRAAARILLMVENGNVEVEFVFADLVNGKKKGNL